MTRRQNVDLTEGSVLRGILLFALPLMLSNLLQQLYNAVDSAVVGSWAGEISLAAVGSTAALINLLIGLFLGIATGTGVLYAMHYGSRDWAGLKRICDCALLLSVLAAAVISVAGIACAKPLLGLMKMPEDVMPEASLYLRIYLAGTIFNLLYNVAAGMIRARGDSVRPLVYLAISGVLNLLFDLALVAGVGMGAAGAAIATVAAQLVSCILSLRYLMRLPEEYRFRPLQMQIHARTMLEVIRISIPCGLQNSMFSISNLLVQTHVNSFGAMAMAGVSAYGKIDGFIYMPSGALALTVSTYVGQNIGAGHWDRVRRGIRTCVLLGALVVLAMGLLVIGNFQAAIGLFTHEPEVISYARSMMWYLAPCAWCFSIADILGGALRGSGCAGAPLAINAACICLFRIVYLSIALHLQHAIYLVFLCYPLSWALSTVCMLIYYFGFSKLRKHLRGADCQATPSTRRGVQVRPHAA